MVSRPDNAAHRIIVPRRLRGVAPPTTRRRVRRAPPAPQAPQKAGGSLTSTLTSRPGSGPAACRSVHRGCASARGGGRRHRSGAAGAGLAHARSWTRIVIAPSARGAVTTSMLTPGKLVVVELHRRADVGAASSASVRSGSTQARCGLPTSTTNPSEPPAAHDRRADTEPVDLPISTVTSALTSSARCTTTGRGPASEPTTNSSRRSKPAHPQVVGEHPDTVTAHLGDGTVGVAVVHASRARRHRRAAGRGRPRPAAVPAVVTAARRRRPGRGAGRTAQRPPRRVPGPAPPAGRAAARSRSACRGPWRISPVQDTCPGGARQRAITSSASPAADPSSQTIR